MTYNFVRLLFSVIEHIFFYAHQSEDYLGKRKIKITSYLYAIKF